MCNKEKRMDYSDALSRSGLFQGIEQNEREEMIACLSGKYREYEKDEMIIWEGDTISDAGIVLSGRAKSIKTDISGRQVIVTPSEPGQLYRHSSGCQP